jgi:hypothetical protein
MIRLTKGQVLQMHAELIAATGGSSGIRDEALLDAALAAPFMSFGGMDLYPSLEQKAARLGYGLIKNPSAIHIGRTLHHHPRCCRREKFAGKSADLDRSTQKDLGNR